MSFDSLSLVLVKPNSTSITQTQGLIFKAYPKPRGLLKFFFVIPAIKDENKFTFFLKKTNVIS